MKTVTYEQVLAMHPCWCDDDKGRRRLKRYSDRLGGKATALDILALKRVPAPDRLWLVLREDFIDAPILHEFACRCAERALTAAGVSDKRSWAAIQAKRDWLAGKITDEQLAAAEGVAEDAAQDAAQAAAQAAAQVAAQPAAQPAARAAARSAAWAAALAAAWVAAQAAARVAARVAARTAAWDAARTAAWDAALAAAQPAAWDAALAAAQPAAWDAALAAERAWQIEELTKMLEEADDE